MPRRLEHDSEYAYIEDDDGTSYRIPLRSDHLTWAQARAVAAALDMPPELQRRIFGDEDDGGDYGFSIYTE